MNKQLAEIAYRRRLLVETIEAQRVEVAAISQHWQKPVALVDAGLNVWRLLRRHPALTAGGVTALLALRHNGILGLAQTGGRLLFLYPSAISFVMKLFFNATQSNKPDTEQ